MMDSLYDPSSLPDKIPDWKPSALARSLILSDKPLASTFTLATMASTPELEQVILQLSEDVPISTTTSMDNFVPGLQKLQASVPSSSPAPTCLSSQMSPASIAADVPSAQPLSGQRTGTTHFNFTFPESPAASLSGTPPPSRSPALNRESKTSGQVSNAGRIVPELAHERLTASGVVGATFDTFDPTRQEELKKERKKERNRLAAMKCRRRKIEREMELEGKVKTLKRQNTDLQAELVRLRSQVVTLKHTLMSHIQSGCVITTQY